MSDDADGKTKGGRGLRPVLGLVVVLALALGVGYGVNRSGIASGLLAAGNAAPGKPDVSFVELDPMTVSLPASASARHLRFRAVLEVDSGDAEVVALLRPRILDVMNTYLAAVDLSDVEDPAALVTLRAQMRRRIDLVVGDARVRDLLIQEFVVN